jgi:predicted nucleic acid-binding protein
MAGSGVILDAGPIVAYLANDEEYHGWATAQLQRHTGPLITCEAVLGEAFFLLRRLSRHRRLLRQMLADGMFDLAFHLSDHQMAVSELMKSYADVPMSLADACLVRLSEIHPRLPVLTLDSDFLIYRRARRQHIPVILPE